MTAPVSGAGWPGWWPGGGVRGGYGAQLAELAALVDTSAVRVAVDSVYPLELARAAHERASEEHLRGKIVLTTA